MSFPFYNEQFTFTQPDGTRLEVRGWGDQHHAVFETLDGYTVVEDPVTGFYQYAGLFNEELKPIGIIPDFIDAHMLPVNKSLRNSRAVIKAKVSSSSGLPPAKTRWKERREQAKNELIYRLSSAVPMPAPPQRQIVGNYVGLCLLIQFPDVPGTISPEKVEAFCNQSGYSGFHNNGSVYDYFYENSGGKLQYTNIVAPYYTARYPRNYYTNEAIPQPVRTIELIEEALTFHKANGFDFSRLTSDNEDFVFALNIFYAGRVVNNWAKGLWPHAYQLNNPFPLSAGKFARDYQITDIGDELTLGTFCHENGHMICDFPDLYDYGYESRGVGAYCLMCAGGNANKKNPVHVGAYLKYKAGWSGQVSNLTAGLQVSIMANRNNFFVLRKNLHEYYILEYRIRSGRDSSLPGAGLLIWHVDELGDNSNEQMTPTAHYECSLIQADGRNDLENGINDGDATDVFCAPIATNFSSNTHPRFCWWDDGTIPLEIYAISSTQNPLTFSTRDI